MNHFLEIKVMPDPEFLEQVLLNALFSKFHRALVFLKEEDVGVSFPDFYKKNLGTRLRIHGTFSSLEKLIKTDWLKALQSYVMQSGIKEIPAQHEFRVVKRVQAKSNIERLLRRSVAKGWLTEEEANKQLLQKSPKKLELPYLQLRSSSTDQYFRLFIDQSTIVNKPNVGKFNTYGLSNNTTVPWF